VRDVEAVAGGEYQAPKGDLIMAAPIVFGRLHVLPIVCDFLAQFPEIRIGMVLSDGNANLTDDHIDVAVRIGELPDSSLVATRVGSVRRVVCASPRYLAAHGTPNRRAAGLLERLQEMELDIIKSTNYLRLIGQIFLPTLAE
jgi:DNA-binding transcriptional LysR family regulator